MEDKKFGPEDLQRMVVAVYQSLVATMPQDPLELELIRTKRFENFLQSAILHDAKNLKKVPSMSGQLSLAMMVFCAFTMPPNLFKECSRRLNEIIEEER